MRQRQCISNCGTCFLLHFTDRSTSASLWGWLATTLVRPDHEHQSSIGILSQLLLSISFMWNFFFFHVKEPNFHRFSCEFHRFFVKVCTFTWKFDLSCERLLQTLNQENYDSCSTRGFECRTSVLASRLRFVFIFLLPLVVLTWDAKRSSESN